ncbi:MAG: hypothetical protein KGY46_05135 [Anaerolineales bacterium]|nr:hypothetical protein [Anaerolineales bacterium]
MNGDRSLNAPFFFLLAFLLSSCAAIMKTQPQDTALPTQTPPAKTTKPANQTNPSPQLNPTPTSTLLPTPSPTPETSSTTLYAVVGVSDDDVLNIREGPGAENEITATIPPHSTDIQTTGEGVDVDGSKWVPIEYLGEKGWVNAYFLAEQVGKVDPELFEKSNQVLQALKEKDFRTLSDFVHPEKCLCFSPYPTLHPEDLVFCPAQIKTLAADQTKYEWGQFDGTGKPINMTFSEYYERFIYDVDFAHADLVGFNEVIGTGNAINNIQEYFPQAVFIEYHFPEFDPQYAGMDWRSIRLVFEKQNQEWYLVCVVHGEWTI